MGKEQAGGAGPEDFIQKWPHPRLPLPNAFHAWWAIIPHPNSEQCRSKYLSSWRAFQDHLILIESVCWFPVNCSSFQLVKNQISNLKYKEAKTPNQNKKEAKRIQKNEDNVRSHWDNFKHTNICIRPMLEGEKRARKEKGLIDMDNSVMIAGGRGV